MMINSNTVEEVFEDASSAQPEPYADCISRQEAINKKVLLEDWTGKEYEAVLVEDIKRLPSAQSEYEPAKLEDFAKTMSAHTLYSFMSWYGEALELMEKYGFVICKKTM